MTNCAASSIQSGKTLKHLAGKKTIFFPKAFISTPVVVVTPFYDDGRYQVNNVPTIIHADAEKFTVKTENGGVSFYINWVAIGI